MGYELGRQLQSIQGDGVEGTDAAYAVLQAVGENLALGQSDIGTHFNDVRQALGQAAEYVRDDPDGLHTVIYDSEKGLGTVWRNFNKGREAAYDRGNTVTAFRVSNGQGAIPKTVLEFRNRGDTYEWRDLRQSETWQSIDEVN